MPDKTARLLLPYDDSPSARRAAELVAAWHGAAAPEVIALNVQQRPAMVRPEGALTLDAVDGALQEAGEKILSRLPGQAMELQVRLGFVADTIRREAAERGVAAIVMGTRGAGPLRGFALGSVALRVAQSGVAPTLLVKEDSPLPAAPGKALRVLLASDGSEPSVRAAQRLAAWTGWLGELDVQIAHVQEPLTVLEALLPPHDDVLAQWSDAAGKEASRAARELFGRAGIRHHLHLSAGDPALEIVNLAAQVRCELLVMGTRGRGAAHHALVGSVAMKAAASTPLPVLLVP